MEPQERMTSSLCDYTHVEGTFDADAFFPPIDGSVYQQLEAR